MDEAAESTRADDLALARRAARGDGAAFAELFVRYEQRVVGWAAAVVRSADDARDVSQEVFLRAIQALPGFRGEAAFATWLYRITFRQSLNWKERVAGRRAEVPPEGLPEPADPAPGPEALALRRLDAARVRRAIARLPERERTVLVWRDLRGLSEAETARRLGRPLNTVKTHLRRARARLRAMLAAERP